MAKAMKNIFTKLMTCFCVVFVGAGCSSNNTITAYPVLCEKEKFTSQGECGRGTPLNRTTYQIDKTKQEVFSWMPGLGLETNRYTKCAVLSVNQWSCKYDDGSGTFGFSEGKYFNEPTQLPHEIHVTKEEWENFFKD